MVRLLANHSDDNVDEVEKEKIGCCCRFDNSQTN